MPDHRLSPLTKSDLQYRYAPPPTASDDPSKRGEPDSSLLNRGQWYEVLYFINKFANDCGQGARQVALKAERLIHKHLPGNLRSHENIKEWLLRNWQMFPNA
jgi:hypothetical protein